MNAFLSWLLDLLFPPKCMLCGKLMPDAATMVCEKCGYDLPEWEGVPRKIKGYDACSAPFFYEEPIRSAILRFKFHGMQSYAKQFAVWMAARAGEELKGKYDLVTWVPCSRRRRWERGFDQSELLARALAKELGAEVCPLLQKHRHNRKQSKIKGAARRRANVQGVYRPLAPEKIRNRRILVVDDIVTTGATMEECGKVLLLHGASQLVCAAIAIARSDQKK